MGPGCVKMQGRRRQTLHKMKHQNHYKQETRLCFFSQPISHALSLIPFLVFVSVSFPLSPAIVRLLRSQTYHP